MRQHVVATALVCWTTCAVAASTSPSAVVDGFVRAGEADADLAGKVTVGLRLLRSSASGPTVSVDCLGSNWTTKPCRLFRRRHRCAI